eukprot:gene9788-11435_t
MKLLSLLVCTIALAVVANASWEFSRCHEGVDQVIYSDSLHYTVNDWSWSNTRQFNNCAPASPVHSGTHSFSFVPKTYDAMYFNLQNPIDPSKDNMISFWVHGGGASGQKVYLRLTQNKVPVSRDFFLWGADSIITNRTDILGNCWSHAVINLDVCEPGLYDGIQIIAFGNDVQPRVYFDDLEVMRRCCATDPFRKTLPTTVCTAGTCVAVTVKEVENRWITNGVEYQQYQVVFKNTNTKAITRLEFESGYFLPRDHKDVWGAVTVPGGRWGLPTFVTSLAAGQEFAFGCVSQRGPVSFKIAFVEYAK